MRPAPCLSRRELHIFLAGAAACCCLPTGLRADAEESFICTTIDRPQGETFVLDHFAADAGISDKLLSSAIKEFKLTPYGTLFFDDRWRHGDGMTPHSSVITLGIHFMDGSAAKREFVQSTAKDWLGGELASRIAFDFTTPREKSQIRISFDADGGNNSLVGRRALLAPKSKKTMNLQKVTKRSVLHEFGHALGLQHEHLHPAGGIVWNEPVVIAELKKSQGWSESYIRQNIINRFSENAACLGDPEFNKDSIMMYSIPARWTLNGFHSDLSESISARDRRCLAGVYGV